MTSNLSTYYDPTQKKITMEVNLDIQSLSSWGIIPGERPLVISGPCSAESEEQLVSTAKLLSREKKVNVLRAGVWKPRTRPNSFEGIGAPALEWLNTAKQETGLPTAVEVANAYHIEECLKAGVDILWIGARTTVNPFTVQEIADALKGVDIPVMVKNPINPDLALWMGAMERLNQSGIKKLAAIHRGFSTFEKSKFRNLPMWNLPIELRRLVPELPIICDPSHICGNRELLFEVSQKALDLNFNGLMIESHINPAKALSDAAQQLTPDALTEMLTALALREPTTTDASFLHTLEELRTDIDQIDNEIINIMGRRMQIVEKIGAFKADKNITILQTKRWDDIVKSRLQRGGDKGLTEKFIVKMFEAIHQESIRKQTEVMNAKKA